MAVVQMMVVFRVITLCSVVGFSYVSEEGTASIFSVPAIQVDAEMSGRIKCVGYIRRFAGMPFLYNRRIFFFPLTSAAT
jgi:hypothetical protein